MTGTESLFAGFAKLSVDTARVNFAGAVGGTGTPVLLLHGYPQTHAAWHAVAPALAQRHTVVVPDLPGYGRSLVTKDGLWDKRECAAELVDLMRALGHGRFHVVGHDRGARVGYRLALDHPASVVSFSALAVVPTLDVWPAIDAAFASGAFHWFLFLQPGALPEQLLAANPAAFLDAALTGAAGSLDRLHPAALADYRAAFRRPSVRAAMIADYRAAPASDLANDADDRAAGHSIACPVLSIWADERLVATGVKGATLTAVDIWRRWSADVTGVTVPCGHLIPEHASDAVIRAVLPFVARAECRNGH